VENVRRIEVHVQFMADAVKARVDIETQEITMELKDIEQALIAKSEELEKERIAALEKSVKESEELRLAIEKKRSEGLAVAQAFEAEHIRSRIAKQEAEAQRIREENEILRRAEREHNLAQDKVEQESKDKAELSRRLTEMELAEDKAKKALRDAELFSVFVEDAPPHPLAKFLQHEPK
jgi:hypothetical protein